MTFPGDIVLNSIFWIQAPDKTSIKENDYQGDDDKLSVSSDKAAQHQEESQAINQGARSYMDAATSSAPSKKSGRKQQNDEDLICYRAIEIVQRSPQHKYRYCVCEKMFPIAMKKMKKQYTRQTFKAKRFYSQEMEIQIKNSLDYLDKPHYCDNNKRHEHAAHKKPFLILLVHDYNIIRDAT